MEYKTIPVGPIPDTAHSILFDLRRSCPKVWDRIIVQYGPMVYSWARRFGLQPQDAEDVAQQIFLNLVRRRCSYDSELGSLRGYLYQATKNTTLNLLRKRAPKIIAPELLSIMEQSQAVDPENQPKSLALIEAIEKLRAFCPPRDFDVGVRTFLHEQHPKDIAEELSITEAAVYTAKSRFKAHLRKLMSGQVLV